MRKQILLKTSREIKKYSSLYQRRLLDVFSSFVFDFHHWKAFQSSKFSISTLQRCVSDCTGSVFCQLFENSDARSGGSHSLITVVLDFEKKIPVCGWPLVKKNHFATKFLVSLRILSNHSINYNAADRIHTVHLQRALRHHISGKFSAL
jgi:hypothetical protein